MLDKASGEPDSGKRKDIYCEVIKTVFDQAPYIYLYQRGGINSYRDRLQGWQDNGWSEPGWNAQDWWVKDAK